MLMAVALLKAVTSEAVPLELTPPHSPAMQLSFTVSFFWLLPN